MCVQRVGYPCINTSIGCTANSTFRLASYSKERLVSTVEQNLDCLQRILRWNLDHNILFFRIGSQLVPFASHEVCQFNWLKHFKKRFREIGRFVRDNDMRVSMHPDQFVVLNSPRQEVVHNSIAELEYHCALLDAMKLNATAKVMIHVGGVYGDKPAALARFADVFSSLHKSVKKRLVVENDDRLFCVSDCLELGLPVVFDTLHHELNHDLPFRQAIESAAGNWSRDDGLLIVHYSSQKPGAKPGSHTEHIDLKHFRRFLNSTDSDFDVMLEIKDKEKSALEALKLLQGP